MRRFGQLLVASVAIVAIALPTAAQDPPSPPQKYVKLFNAVSNDVAAFAAAAPSCPNNTTHPLIVAEIGGADANFLQRSLPQASPSQMATMVQNAVDEAKLLHEQFGVEAVETSMSYPILVDNPANLPNNGTLTTAYFDKYLQFYEDFAAGVRGLGLKLIVESNLNLPGQDNYAFTYKGITLAQLQAGMTEVTQHILDNVHPDVLDIFSEPSTLAGNTGLKELMTPSVYAQFIVAMRQAYDTSNSPQTLFSAGSSDCGARASWSIWSPPMPPPRSISTFSTSTPIRPTIFRRRPPTWTIWSARARRSRCRKPGTTRSPPRPRSRCRPVGLAPTCNRC